MRYKSDMLAQALFESRSASKSDVIIPNDIPSNEWNSIPVSEKIKIYTDYLEYVKKEGIKLSREEKDNNFRRISKICLGIKSQKDLTNANRLINIAIDNNYVLKGDQGKLVKDLHTGKTYNKLEEAKDWSGYKVRYTYPGDSLSDYEGTCIVRADNEKQAINIAKVELRDINARNFRIDGEINSYNDYKKKYPKSNFEVFEGIRAFDKGTVEVKKTFTVKEFDEDDGWNTIKIKPGIYKYRVLNVRGWKPRQLFIDNEWIDIADNCEELEGMLSEGVNESKIAYHYTGKNLSDLEETLRKDNLSLSIKDYSNIKHRSRDINGDKVTLNSSDGDTYKGTFNRYFDGDLEIIDIQKV